MNGIDNVEQLKTNLEKVMMGLNPNVSEESRKQYMAGVIDTLQECGVIDEELRTEVYLEYCF